MEIPHLSASSGKTYDQCRFKFLVEYALGLSERISFKENYAANLGSHLHEIFEKIAQGTLTKNNWLEWSRPKQPELYTLAQVKHPDCSDIATQVSDDCQRLFDCLFDRDPIFNPLEARHNILGIEYPFLGKLGNVPVKGYMDLVFELDKETLEVYDYKTGTWALSYHEAEKDLQVLMYYLAAKRDFPKYKSVLVTLDYLQRKPVTVALTDNHAKKGMRKIQGLWRKIKHDTKPYRHKEPIWVCNSFCDREKCDRYWCLFKRAGGNISKFRDNMAHEIQAEKTEEQKSTAE